MSRAIREEIERNSEDGTLKGLPDETLSEYVEIVSALALDMRDEAQRRLDEIQDRIHPRSPDGY
jgi:hypothetical protein